MLRKAFINLHSSEAHQAQCLGIVPGFEREGFLGLRVAVLDVLRDGCAVAIDRPTAKQAGVSSYGV